MEGVVVGGAAGLAHGQAVLNIQARSQGAETVTRCALGGCYCLAHQADLFSACEQHKDEKRKERVKF